MDREQVIKGLTCCSQHGDGWCAECPYHDVCLDGYGIPLLASDALELLGDQTLFEPYLDFDGHDVWRCGNCHTTLFHIYDATDVECEKAMTQYCKRCGKQVKWE